MVWPAEELQLYNSFFRPLTLVAPYYTIPDYLFVVTPLFTCCSGVVLWYNPVMGDPVPPDWPELDDYTLYRVTVDAFGDASEKTDCTQTYLGEFQGNVWGIMINAWLSGDNECKNNHGILPSPSGSAQRLINVEEI